MPISSDPLQLKRHVLVPPYSAGDFNAGEFVYLPDLSLEEARSGMVVERNGQWIVCLTPKKLIEPWEEVPLGSFSQPLGRDILVDFSGIGTPRGPRIDATPWHIIKVAVISLLEAAKGYRLRPDELTAMLRQDIALDQDLVPDVLRMCITMGVSTVTIDKSGSWYNLSKLFQESAERRRYLASFSEELLVKSRRIDHLVQHTGTVGSYREGLLRSMLRQVLPQRYEVSTGFLENCPRQLDIIIWDAHLYGALFRDGDVVVVPASSVRAIIEVKTTLSTGPLDEALEILYDVMRVDPPLLPVFMGIFAFESGYTQSQSVAERVREFHLGNMPNGIGTREHNYLYQGVKTICVPHSHLIRQTYLSAKTVTGFPRPLLKWFDTSGSGDINTAVFIADILTYLDVEPAVKRIQLQLFLPLFRELKEDSSLQLFADSWRPSLTRGDLSWPHMPEGAEAYIQKIIRYRLGEIDAKELVAAPVVS